MLIVSISELRGELVVLKAKENLRDSKSDTARKHKLNEGGFRREFVVK